MALIALQCPVCEAAYERPVRKQNKFCSRACYHKSDISKENGRRTGASLKGRPSNNPHGNGGATKGRKATERQREGLSVGWHMKKDFVVEHCRKLGQASKGRPNDCGTKHLAAYRQTETPEQKRARFAKSGRARRGKPAPWAAGEKCIFWRGGTSVESRTARQIDMSSIKYINWRRSVFERDDFICQLCGQRGGHLHADHIKAYAQFPKDRYDLSNGRTLCVPCHRGTDTYGRASAVKSGG